MKLIYWPMVYHSLIKKLLPIMYQLFTYQVSSWPWSYGSWIYNYLCNQCLSPLMLWVRISIRVRCITLCDKVCQWFATGRWFSLGHPVSSTNKTDCHDITEILLKVALNTIKPTYLLTLASPLSSNCPLTKVSKASQLFSEMFPPTDHR